MPPTRRVCRRNRQNGGGQGGSVSFAVPSFAPLVNNPLAFGTGSNCATSSGSNHSQYASYRAHGLPGMNGGRRKGRQAGGAYGFNGTAGIVGGYPGAASYTPVSSIGCTGASPVAIPLGSADNLNKVGGVLWDAPVQRGGQLGQLSERTAGYTFGGSGSVIPTSAGTSLAAVMPVNGRMGGGRRGKGRSRRGRKAPKSKSKSRHSKKRR